jgi:hypothetical protein
MITFFGIATIDLIIVRPCLASEFGDGINNIHNNENGEPLIT